jgi:RHS repeat-associated protein
MTTGVSQTITYNWDNKLRTATKGSKSISLRYDPGGNRIRKQSIDGAEETTHKYIVDIVGDLPTTLMEIDPNIGLIVKTYIYANGQVLCQHDGDYSAPRYFYIHDRLGSVRQMIDTSANVVKYYTYEPFGEVLEEDGTLTNYMMFTSQYFDTEIDQYYLRARQYDPHISRFTARDPIRGKFEEPLTLHIYLYCLNDPINKIDPSGLWAYYITGGFLGSLGFSYAGQGGIVWDDQGNWGIIGIDSYGGGLPAAVSVGMNFGITNAETILQLRGPGWAAGGGGSVSFFGAGAEYIWGEEYQGMQFNIGAGISLPVGFEGHIHRTQTDILPARSQTLSFEDIVGMAAAEAFYQATTYGEARSIIHFMAITDVDFGVLM